MFTRGSVQVHKFKTNLAGKHNVPFLTLYHSQERQHGEDPQGLWKNALFEAIANWLPTYSDAEEDLII